MVMAHTTSPAIPLPSPTFAGATFKVPATDLIYSNNGDGTCIAGFGYSSLNFAILGNVFLQNNYVIFNQAIPNVPIAPLAGL
ncbi:hypothetical protein BC936DRAFT_142461 [Jimgerdemannia flammicorona]|uniref:Peptidase A1 domain-containing protein n=1 Tax=Jimgerdemannia flammicorona TaxID=994334 RepID=A0A433A0I3_9FUNG|nr:hypothetical protein BC936DRAFT_142461 [Jimgerdemannia flammicorona]